MKWTKTHRQKLTAIIRPHKSDPPDFFPSADEAWAKTGLDGEPPQELSEAWMIAHFSGGRALALTAFSVESFGLETTIGLIRAASDACEYDVLPDWASHLRRYFYRAEEAEFMAVRGQLFEGYDVDEPRAAAKAAFVLSRDTDYVEAAIAGSDQYQPELVATAPTADLALQVVARSNRGLISFPRAFDLVENLGEDAVPVLEAILARYEGKAAFRKPIEQALKVAGADPKKKAAPKKAAPKKAAAKKAAPKKAAPKKAAAGSPAGESGYAKYAVAGSTSGGKFWQVKVHGAEMRIRYGKVGADPKWSSKAFHSADKAVQEATKKFNSKTRKGYVETAPPTEVSAGDVTLSESHVVGTFYFRTFDRAPGGNIDTTTIKATFRSSPAETGTLVAKQVANWDGEHFSYDEAPVSLDLSETAPAMLSAAQSLIEGGLAQSTFTVIDPRKDSDEYDTEWSSLEFTIHTLPSRDAAVKDGELVLHFLQKALSYTKQKGSPPDAVSQGFRDSVMALVGIGRVVDLNESSAFRGAHKPASTSHGYQDEALPLFL